ncbi:ParB/RepB/Spo0J family partition protein [Altererythrobacter lutimaris]|uniref:ParB/RepB/Spo0J family partition protein n=1 Tax=Altererythrobacter lutimaris TaxID=2743979 RepID=A0A850HBF7_9SPHN|nr:ParB/RepB/Spo0J family partition protein [Altererythrobacter lutimaris]NVE95413.1 ParB/RepB/Spo0J family partition protein [Altererythrobacter lutimaris]
MSDKSDSSSKTPPLTVPPRSPADRKRKLGKGLGALLGETRKEEPLTLTNEVSHGKIGDNSGNYIANGLAQLAISSIEPLPGQPRQHFNEEALEELASSIATRGVIQPIIVRPRGNGKYQLIAGERRWRAAQKARLHEIPALVRDLDDTDTMALALIENLQREDLGPVEEARAYQKLADKQDMTQADIAKMVEKSRSHVANLMRLLSLPEGVLEMVEGGKLSMGHARAMIGYDGAVDLAKRVVANGLSVREVERLVKGPIETKSAKRPSKVTSEKDADIAAVQTHLEDFLGMTVRINTDGSPTSGAVTIKYRTLDQLDLICQRLTGGDI